MRTTLYILLLMIATALLWGCSPRASRQSEALLCAADSLMESRPDSALALLDTLTSASFPNPEQKARFALLKSQALDKNFIDLTDDSLIAIADGYYSAQPSADPSLRIRAAYYHGRIFYNAKEFPTALMHFTDALDLATEISDFYWMGRTASQMSDVYLETYHASEQEYYSDIAYKCFDTIHCQPYLNDAILDKAKACIQNNRFQDAIIFARQTLDSAIVYDDKNLIKTASSDLALAYYCVSKPKDALEILNPLYESYPDDRFIAELILKNRLLIGEDNSNVSIHEDSLVSSNPFNAIMVLGYAKLRHDYPLALKAADRLTRLSDSILGSALNMNFTQTTREIYNAREAVKKSELRQARMQKWIIALSLTLVLVVILAVLGPRLLKQRRTISSQFRLIGELKRSIALQRRQYHEAERKIKELYREQFDVVDDITARYFEQQADRNVERKIYRDVKSLIARYSSDSAEFKKMCRKFDEYNSNVFTLFDQEFPEMKPEDRNLFRYVALGFKASAIALFIGADNAQSVYNRKRRLKAKIAESAAIYKQLYLDILG